MCRKNNTVVPHNLKNHIIKVKKAIMEQRQEQCDETFLQKNARGVRCVVILFNPMAIIVHINLERISVRFS